MLKDQITTAALEVLITQGPDQWTMARVATEAGCAKGLVHYHHGTKERLLASVADRLASERADSRLDALTAGGTDALDALWRAISHAAQSGRTAAWLALLTQASPLVRQAAQPPTDYYPRLARAMARALALERVDEPAARAIDAALDGFEQALLRDDALAKVHEAFHQAWLAVL